MAEREEYMLSKPAEWINEVFKGAVVGSKPMPDLSEQFKAQFRANIGAGSSDNGMTILGYFDTFAELQTAITAPKPGDAYGVGLAYPYDIYIWDQLRSRWVNNGPIRGADGAPGADGADGKDGKDAEVSLAFQIVLQLENWANNQQSVLDERFVAEGYSFVVSPASASFAKYAEAVIHADDVTENGSMLFYAETVPTEALSVNVVRMVVSE